MRKLLVIFTLAILNVVFAQESGSAKDIIAKNIKCVLEDKTPADKCLTNFFVEIRPQLAAGIPELKVPALNPMHIDEISFPDDSVLLQGKNLIYNITVDGVGDYTVKNITVDYDKQTITLHLFFNKAYAEGLYNVDANFLILPVKGEGPMNMNFTDVDMIAIATLERTAKGVDLSKLDLEFEPKHMAIFLSNILGDGEVSEAVNKLINDNAHEVIKELKPALKAKMGASLKNVIDNVVKELPHNILIKQE